MNRDLVEGRLHVEKGVYFPMQKLIQRVIHARNRQLTKLAQLIQLTIINGDTYTTRFLGNNNQGTRIRGSRVLHEASGQVLVKNGVNLFRNNRIHTVRTRLDRCTSWRNSQLERKERTRTEINGGAREHIMVFLQKRPQIGDDL